MKKLCLLCTLLMSTSLPFAAELKTGTEDATSFQEGARVLAGGIVVPSTFANDLELQSILDCINAREATVGSSVYPLLGKDHPRHKKWRSLEEAFAQGLKRIESQDADLTAVFSDMYNQIASADIRFHVDHLRRISSPAGKAVFEYDSHTLSRVLDWIQTNLTEEAAISDMANTHLVFNLLTDPMYGSKQFVEAVMQPKPFEEGFSEKLFAFLKKQRAGVIEERELTLDDCSRLITLLTQ